MAPAPAGGGRRGSGLNACPAFHEGLDLVDLARRGADPLESLVRDDVIVLDANAGILEPHDRGADLGDERAVLRRVGKNVERTRADVDARLDGERVADLVGAVAKRRLN